MEQDIKITTLTHKRLEEAVGVMLMAFKDEAFTSFWLDLADPRLKSAYAVVVKMLYTIHLDAGDPIYAALENNRIVGTAGLITPGARKSKFKSVRLFIRNLTRLFPLFPSILRAARMLYGATKLPAGLPKNNCTLEILAVDPDYQGRGIARRLLEQIHHDHLSDNNYSGIYLLTGDEKNVSIYERFGYKVVEKRIARGLTAYHMFKING